MDVALQVGRAGTEHATQELFAWHDGSVESFCAC